MPTIPGYSKVLVARTGEAPEWEDEPAASAAGRRSSTGPSATRGHLSRLTVGDLSAPTSAASREALTEAVNRCSNLGKHLAFVEMLMALGSARESGSLEAALEQVRTMEDELEHSVSGLLRKSGVAETIT